MLLSYHSTKQRLSPECLSPERRLHFYDKGEEIPLISQGVWQVYRGVVQLGKFNPNGEETLLGWVQPLNFFGLWLTSIDTYQAKALSGVYLKWYALSEIEDSPHLSQTILNQVVHRIRQTEALLAIAGLKLVEERLMELLRLLAKEMGEPMDNGTRLIVRLTHQNLADAIGTTRVTVTRLLGDFQRQNLISFDGDRHLIINH
jgi:CRP-like cAMP-binding protein